MSREYLFKGKTYPKEEGVAFNNVWIEGDLVISRDKYYIHPRANAFEVNNELSKLVIMHEVIPETVCEYVGLKDKNGKKIFEDDVFAYRYKNLKGKEITRFYVITYDNELGYWSPFGNSDCGFYAKDIEIIGNIHDNKELLGE